ncbi:MAG: FtsX-like permease family protein [Candidatus Azobacteroides sp.]|nr:FtsX-like permease family protein [Candidatus Azobacteroides sp.]
MFCILISSFILLENRALNNGIQFKLKEGINQAISGQLTIYCSNEAKINIIESQLKDQKPFPWNAENTEMVKQIDPNLTINNRIRFSSLISYEEETSFVNIHAIEDDHFKRIQNLITLKEGTIPKNNEGILISETLANDLHCGIGDTLLLVADNLNDYMSDEIVPVKGIFMEAGLTSFFAYSAFLPYSLGKEIVQLEDGNSLELIINSSTRTDISDKTIQKIHQYLAGISFDIQAATWDQTIPLFYTIAHIWKTSGYLIQALFIIFSLIILTNLISLTVYSRKKEFGTLLAMGFSWKKITMIIGMEYLVLCVFSVLSAFILIRLLNLLFTQNGLYISSKDMQQALLTEVLVLFLNSKDLINTLTLFCLTILTSTLFSIFRIKKLSPIQLINNK